MYLEISILVFLLVAFAFICINSRHRRCLKNLPGPKPLILFGNTLDFIFQPTSQYISVIESYMKNHGRIIKIHDGPFSVMVTISDYKLTEHMLNSSTMITKTNQYDYLHSWLGSGLLTSTGTKWKTHRRLITPSFHFSILAQFVDIFETVGNVFIQNLNRKVGIPSVDIYPLVSLYTLDVICEAAMGISVNAQQEENSEYVRSVKAMLRILIDRTVTPIHKWLYPLTRNYYNEKKALKVLHTCTNDVIDRKIMHLARKGTTSSNKDDNKEDDCGSKQRLAFLDMLLESSIDGKLLSRTELREEVDTFMFEGHDTTSSAISFALYSLATHPEVQQKVLDEQISLFGNNKSPIITLSDLQNMKYLELVIKETLRLYPSVPVFGRNVAEDFEWDGITFPKGLNILIFAYNLQRNPDYFPNPDKFIPERFEDYSGKDPFSYIPFSAGPRNCIGQKFAMLEMKSTISKVIRHFELSPSVPECIPQLAPETILVSKNGVCLSLRNREM